jgi:G3E family GTPase
MPSERIPVSIVTGFLGSGKTTLIAALLRQPGMAGTAVVVNEFGEAGIDDAVFADAIGADNVRLLANGCLCCTAGDDLVKTVWALTRREADRPRRIVVETTGLADPVPLLHRLMADPRLRLSTRLDAIIATVDAVNGPRNLDDQNVARRQAAVADRRLVTKADLAEPGAVLALEERLRALNPGAPVRRVSFGAIEANELFGASLYDHDSGRADVERWLGIGGRHNFVLRPHRRQDIRFSGGPDQDDVIGTWLVEEEQAVEWATLSPLLGEIIARHGESLLRLKGVIRTTDDPRPLVIHGVQRLFHSPVRLERWASRPATTIVAIGDRGATPAIEGIRAALDTAMDSAVQMECWRATEVGA